MRTVGTKSYLPQLADAVKLTNARSNCFTLLAGKKKTGCLSLQPSQKRVSHRSATRGSVAPRRKTWRHGSQHVPREDWSCRRRILARFLSPVVHSQVEKGAWRSFSPGTSWNLQNAFKSKRWRKIWEHCLRDQRSLPGSWSMIRKINSEGKSLKRGGIAFAAMLLSSLSLACSLSST